MRCMQGDFFLSKNYEEETCEEDEIEHFGYSIEEEGFEKDDVYKRMIFADVEVKKGAERLL